MSTFYKLSVKEVKKETDHAVSILFDIPSNLQTEFKFIPGQYITIKKELNGTELRRAYSICSSLSSNAVRIGIKAVPEGSFSVYASNSLHQGDVLEVSAPEGRFTLNPDPNAEKNYAAFAAGSGITPVLSIIQSVLEIESSSRFVLMYGNKTVDQVMFKTEIEALRAQYPERFHVHYVYSQANEKDALFGRIDIAAVNYVLKNSHTGLSFDSFYLCGPESMINTVKSDLLSKGYPETHIHFELFSVSIDENPSEQEISDGEASLTVVLDGETETFSMPKKKSILEVALAQGLDAPYSCQGGICSSCLAQITEGKATMDKNSILTDNEVEEGMILTCQAHPVTNKITIDYDAV